MDMLNRNIQNSLLPKDPSATESLMFCMLLEKEKEERNVIRKAYRNTIGTIQVAMVIAN
jgi:hypothetical protein